MFFPWRLWWRSVVMRCSQSIEQTTAAEWWSEFQLWSNKRPFFPRCKTWYVRLTLTAQRDRTFFPQMAIFLFHKTCGSSLVGSAGVKWGRWTPSNQIVKRSNRTRKRPNFPQAETVRTPPSFLPWAQFYRASMKSNQANIRIGQFFALSREIVLTFYRSEVSDIIGLKSLNWALIVSLVNSMWFKLCTSDRLMTQPVPAIELKLTARLSSRGSMRQSTWGRSTRTKGNSFDSPR